MGKKPASSEEATKHFHDLIDRIRSGGQDAVREMIDTYGDALRKIVRYQLWRKHKLRRLFDSTDFMQDVWVDLFHKAMANATFAAPHEFLGFLARMVEMRVNDAWRNEFTTLKRASGPLAPLTADIPDRAPLPERAVEVVDELHLCCWDGEDPTGTAVRLLRAGFGLVAIARRVRHTPLRLRQALLEAERQHLVRHPDSTWFPELPFARTIDESGRATGRDS